MGLPLLVLGALGKLPVLFAVGGAVGVLVAVGLVYSVLPSPEEALGEG